jgi:site-specific DNA-methyltransferase (adenine-specific)
MKDIHDRSVNLILSDLPYGTTACPWDSIIDLEKLWAEYKRIIVGDKGVIVLTCAQPFTTILAGSNLPWLKESLVWEKSRATGFLQANTRHLKKHEDILVFSSGTVVSGKTCRNMTYNPQGLIKLSEPVVSRNGNKKAGSLSYFVGKKVTGKGRKQTHTNYPTSVLRFASESKTVHPTQKPVALMEYLIRTYSNEGDTVLDNCMGSGTTGVACVKVGGRNFIGIEMDQNYFEISSQRINFL